MRGRRSTGRPRKVDCQELAPTLSKIIKAPATKYGFENPLWNCERARVVLGREVGLRLSRATAWRYLRDIGLSCQKPERRALEQDPEARRNWLAFEWPKLRRQAKKERAVIFFEDESTVSLSPTVGRTWSKVGHTPIVRVTGNRGSINVISAISPRGKLLFKVPRGNVNSDEFIRFLRQVLADVPRKRVHMIVDRGPSHTSKKVQTFLEDEPRLQIHFLPSYSPELNPDEYTWERLKKVELKAHGELTKKGLKRRTIGAMRSMQRKKGLVESFVRRVYVT